MKVTFVGGYGKLKAGTVVEADAIRFDPKCVGAFAIRVVGVWKRPKWFSIAFFVEIPIEVGWELRRAAKAGSK